MWQITNTNTLYTTIKRYIKNRTLIPIHKGFYSTVSLGELDPIELGVSFLHTFAYVSTETILARAGIINQVPLAITLISSKSQTFTLAKHTYRVRQLKDEFLHNDFGLVQKGYVKEASLERAVADLLYFDKAYYFDSRQLVDWDKVCLIRREVGY